MKDTEILKRLEELVKDLEKYQTRIKEEELENIDTAPCRIYSFLNYLREKDFFGFEYEAYELKKALEFLSEAYDYRTQASISLGLAVSFLKHFINRLKGKLQEKKE